MVLKNCTVEALIEYLQTLPQDLPITSFCDFYTNHDGSWNSEIEVRKTRFVDGNYPYDRPEMEYIDIE